MHFAISMKVALRNLARTSLRSGLTALGIIIGVAAVVAVVSVGNGARSNVEKTLANLESNQLAVSGDPKPGKWQWNMRWRLPRGDGLTVEDYLAIRQEVPGISAATVRVYGYAGSLNFGKLRANAYGVDAQGFQVLTRKLVRGTIFGEIDVQTAATVAVIPEGLAHAMFGDVDRIGIMNIMLVNVTERTREIGIRMALGTRAQDVMRQFVIEAVLLSACGGVIGVLSGIAVAHTIAYLSNWPTLITPSSIALAFLCSAVIGVFFGYYPAQRAARLDPILALRAE